MSQSISWYYHRKNCTSCTRAQTFMKENGIETPTVVIANKIKFNRVQALDMIRDCRNAMITRGKKRIDLILNDVTDDDLANLALGRSGTLRAPAFIVEDTFVIGYHQEAYGELLKTKE